MKINSNSKSNSNSVFAIVNEYIGSEKFYASIGEYVFCYCVVLFIVCICMLIGAKAIDWFKDLKAKKEAERKAEEEERRRKEEEEKKKKREAEEAADLAELRNIYDLYFNSRIVGKVYKNLREVEKAFEKFHYNEFRQVAKMRKLTDQEFDNFRNVVIESRKKLERVYNY